MNFRLLTPERIIDGAERARREGIALIETIRLVEEIQNQLILFFKPEMLAVHPTHSRALFELALSILGQGHFSLSGAFAVGGPILAKYQIIDTHYGVINEVSRSGSRLLSPYRAAIRELLHLEEALPIFGGHELLEHTPALTPEKLDAAWAAEPAAKLKSGVYVRKFARDDQFIVLANGFHPQQLAHYTMPESALVVLLLGSEMPWSYLRDRVIGDTCPARARVGSLRRSLHDNASALGLGSAGIDNNCVHLSAGPFEALSEMTNFLRMPGLGFQPSDSVLGRRLFQLGMSDRDVIALLSNPHCSVGEPRVSLFDLTEHTDTFSSAHLVAVLWHDGRFLVHR